MSNNKTGKAFDAKLIQRVLKYVNPYKNIFTLTLIFTLIAASISPIRPYLTQWTIDKAIPSNNGSWLIYACVTMFTLLIIEAVLQFYVDFLSSKLGQWVIKDLRNETFKKILHFKLSYFDKKPVGMLVTRSVSDTEQISQVFSDGFFLIISDVLKIVVILLVMLATDWKLALVSILPIPILLYATNIFKNAVRGAFTEVRNAVSNLNTFVQEHLTGITIIQTFNREQQEYLKFEKINNEHKVANIKSIWHYSVFFPIVEILSSVSLGLLIWYASYGIVSEKVSLGSLIAFIMYINMLYRPIRMLADRFNTLQMGVVCSERVFKILDTDASIKQNNNLAPKNLFDHDILLSNIWFAYIKNEYILKDFSLQVSAKKTLAIIGATGSGKSTIIQLLTRFYEYEKGEIKIDNTSLRDIDLSYLRTNIAVVMQDVFLFADTIYHNICLYNKNISEEIVIEASKKLGLHDFIMELPNGYNYEVQERGLTLSVGQRQLISFVRAYVHNPKILILDEATSSVDTNTELRVQKAIEILTQNRTCIIIAHRLSTIRNANDIIVLDKGIIIEKGNHDSLLNNKGKYKELYDIQIASLV